MSFVGKKEKEKKKNLVSDCCQIILQPQANSEVTEVKFLPNLQIKFTLFWLIQKVQGKIRMENK